MRMILGDIVKCASVKTQTINFRRCGCGSCCCYYCCCSLVALVSGFHDAIVTNAVSRGAVSSEESYMGPIRL